MGDYRYGTGEDQWIRVGRNGKPNLSILNDRRKQSLRILTAKRRAFRRQLEQWEARLRVQKCPFRQVHHLVERFGGLLNFSIALGVHPLEVLQWTGVRLQRKNFRQLQYFSPYKTGMLPMHFIGKAILSARTYGVFLTPQDLFPDLFNADVLKNSEGELKEWLGEIQKSQAAQEWENALAELMAIPD